MEARLASVRGLTLRVGRGAFVQKCRADMVQHDVEHDVKARGVRRVDQIAQFVIGAVGMLREARLGAQKVMNAVAVVTAVFAGQVPERRAHPDGAGTELLEIGDLLLDAAKRASLKSGERRIVERLMARRPEPVVEAIDDQEVDPLVAPVGGRRGQSRNGAAIARGVEDALNVCREDGSRRQRHTRSGGRSDIVADLKTIRQPSAGRPS